MISQRMKPSLAGDGGIRKAFNEANRQYLIYGRENVFDLSIGNPAAPPPEKVKEAVWETMNDPAFTHGYMNNQGFQDVREQIIASINRRENTSYAPSELVMTAGVAGGLNAIFCSMIEAGDEVIVFTPFYTAYQGFVENWGGSIVKVPPKGEDFFPDFEVLREKVSSRTKAVIVNSPHNPTGTIYTEEVIQTLAEILNEKQKEFGHEIYLISDEPYRDLVYDGTKIPWIPSYYKDTIISYSFSKSLSLAGERIGYVLIPDQVTDGKDLVRAVMASLGRIGFVNAPALFQKVVGACVDEKVDLEYYAGNRTVLYEALMKAGFEAVPPRGAFYVFVKCPIPEAEFVELARQNHLMVVGGTDFGYGGYVRMSFCCARGVLEGAAKVIEKLGELCNLEKRI